MMMNRKIKKLILLFIVFILTNIFMVSVNYADKKVDLSKYNFNNPFIKKYNTLKDEEKLFIESKIKEVVNHNFEQVFNKEINKRLLIDKTMNSKYINNKYVEDAREDVIFNDVKVSEILFFFDIIYFEAEDYMRIYNYNMSLHYDEDNDGDFVDYDIYDALDKIDIKEIFNEKMFITDDFSGYYEVLIKNIDFDISYNTIEHKRIMRVNYKYKDKLKGSFSQDEDIACELYYTKGSYSMIKEEEFSEFVLFLYDEGIFR